MTADVLVARPKDHRSSIGKIATDLNGVPATLFWPLYNRATEARRSDGVMRDPDAVRILDAIDYPYARHFGAPSRDSALRALRFDEQIRLYLRERPAATVVGLGEGLETQYLRLYNGQLRWLAVDLPETVALRRQFIPDTDHHRNLACSALDWAWMDAVDPSRGVIITAQGLLMYFDEADVRRLIGKCAERFPGAWMILDTIPRAMSAATVAGLQKTPDYQPPPMPWGLDAGEVGEIGSYHPNIRDVAWIALDPPKGFTATVKAEAKRLLGRVDDAASSVVRLRFGPGD